MEERCGGQRISGLEDGCCFKPFNGHLHLGKRLAGLLTICKVLIFFHKNSIIDWAKTSSHQPPKLIFNHVDGRTQNFQMVLGFDFCHKNPIVILARSLGPTDRKFAHPFSPPLLQIREF